MKISDEQRKIILEALEDWHKAPHGTSEYRRAEKQINLYAIGWLKLLLNSEQAWREENERLLAFCKLLASEEEMYQEGKYETEMSRLQQKQLETLQYICNKIGYVREYEVGNDTARLLLDILRRLRSIGVTVDESSLPKEGVK